MNFSFLSSLSDFLSFDSDSSRVVRLWMLPAKVPSVASEGPATADGDGETGEATWMCLSTRSFKYCLTTPSC